MDLGKAKTIGLVLTSAGIGLILVMHWLVMDFVPTEATQGIVQRIFYIHPPAAWITFLAVGISALASAAYLWLEDERTDAAAVAAAEGALIFGLILLTSGPLWGRIAWGTFWQPEPRLTLTLLLWFIMLGYFLVRSSIEDPRKAKRYAAVVPIIGALDIPFIHMSVEWFRSLHPEAVVIKPEGPTADPDMLLTLFVSLGGFTLVFLGLFTLRYAVEMAGRMDHTTPSISSASGAVA
ncbi:MAG: cytochrome c biogenesis protein CcsA [Longimicrobiales bacterium]